VSDDEEAVYPDKPAVPARVWIGGPGLVDDDDQRLLLSAFSDCGAAADDVEVIPARRESTATALTWLVLAALPLQAFLSALGGKLADDAHGRLLAAVKRVAERYEAVRRGRTGPAAAKVTGDAAAPSPVPLILMDSGSKVKIIIEADLPAEAVSLLVALDLSQFKIGPVHFDKAAGRWRAELDEGADR
jgi:hypothetical protein